MEKPTIILDANAFLTGENLLELGAHNNLCTTASVLNQIRDEKSREMLQSFPFKITNLSHTKKSLQIVRDFAKKTGDLSSLSDVDLEVIAVAYQLYSDRGLLSELKSKPSQMKEWTIKEDLSSSEGDESSENSEEPQEQQIKETQQQNKEEETTEIKEDKKKEGDNESDDGWIVVPKTKKVRKQSSEDSMDEDEGWITPKNYEVKINEVNASVDEKPLEEVDEKKNISVMTADFAMQNVLTQMSIPLVSLDGRRIKQIRRFILECYLCWKRYKIEDNKVRLCKQCGYNSLSKIAYSIDENGEMILHRKKGWKPNKKVLEWKQRKYEEQQRKKKHQHARRKKQPSIFQV